MLAHSKLVVGTFRADKNAGGATRNMRSARARAAYTEDVMTPCVDFGVYKIVLIGRRKVVFDHMHKNFKGMIYIRVTNH